MISSIKRNEEIMVNDTSEKKLLEILSQNPIFSNLVYSKKKSTEKNNENLMDSPDSIGKEIKELQEKYQVHMSNVKLNSLALLEDTPSVFVEKYVDKKTFIEDKKTFIEDKKTFNEDKKTFNEDKKTFNEDKKTFNEDKKTFIEKNIDKKSFIEKNGEIKERKKSFGTTNFVNAERFMELNKELDQMILEEERKLKRNNDRLKKNTKETEENQEKNTKEKENERKNIKENQDKNTNENEMKNIYDNKMKITEENEMKITKGKITKENQDKDTKENIENEGKKKRMSFSDPNFVNAEKLMALNNELDQLILEEEEKIKKKLEEKRRNEEKNINENLLRNEHNREESEEKEEKLEKKSKLSKKVDRFMEVDDRNEENLITEEIKEKKKLTKIKEKIQQNKEIEENKEINDEKKIIEEKKIERNPKKTKKNNKNSQENHKIDSKIDKNPAPKTRKSLKNPPKNFPKTHPKQQEIFQTEPEIAISFENSIFIDELHQTPEKNLSPTPIKPPSPAKNRIKHTKKPKTDPQSDPESNKTPIFPNKKPIIKPNSQSLDPKTLKNLKKTTKNDTNNKNNTDNSLPKPRVMKQIIKEKDFYGVTERYPARMRIPTLCYWRPINYSVSQTSDGKKIFNICEEDFDLRGGVSIDPVKKIKLNRQGKAKKIVKSNFQKEEVMDKTINYEIVKDDYDSFLVLISLKCQEKKDFGINQFGPIVKFVCFLNFLIFFFSFNFVFYSSIFFVFFVFSHIYSSLNFLNFSNKSTLQFFFRLSQFSRI